MADEFDSRYRTLKFNNFRKDYKTDDEAFRKLLNELERLQCLVNDENQYKHALCTALLSEVEGCPLLLHVMTKSGVEKDYPTAVEALKDSIQTI